MKILIESIIWRMVGKDELVFGLVNLDNCDLERLVLGDGCFGDVRKVVDGCFVYILW